MSKKADRERFEALQQTIKDGIDAHYQLGWCYKNGRGVEKSMNEAMDCWIKAAAMGHSKATCFLGEMMLGQRTNNNNESWLNTNSRGTIEGEDSEGQYYMGECFYDGKGGVEKNYCMAVEWWKRAARGGNVNAIAKLGVCFRDGRGVDEVDMVQAIAYFKHAAAKGNHEAQTNLAQYYRTGSHDSIPKDLERAVELFEEAAQGGNVAEAQLALGQIYCTREGTEGNTTTIERDPVKGAAYSKMAANQGLVDAKIHLAMCYRHGLGVPQDYHQAVILLHKALQADPGKEEILNDLESITTFLQEQQQEDRPKKNKNQERALVYLSEHELDVSVLVASLATAKTAVAATEQQQVVNAGGVATRRKRKTADPKKKAATPKKARKAAPAKKAASKGMDADDISDEEMD